MAEGSCTLSRSEVIAAAQALSRQGLKINAIKLIRAATGWGFVEINDYVENDFHVPICVGDTVRRLSGTRNGKVLATSGDHVWVLFNEASQPLTIQRDELRKITAGEWDATN